MRYSSLTDRLAETGGGNWALHREARALKASGEAVIELTIGEPDMPPDPGLLAEVARALASGRTGYSNGRGEPRLLDALVTRYAARRPGLGPRNFLCFPGTQTALFAVMLALAEPGAAVLAGDPLYATYEGAIRASGARLVPVPLHPAAGFHLRAEDVARAVTPDSRVLLLNTPHNPTGAVLTRAEIAEIGEVARAHDLWIVSDEVYEDLIFGDRPFASPFDLPELADRVVVVSSISKSHAAPGLRSGWAAGPTDFADRLLPLAEVMLFGNQPFIADATAWALARPFDTAARMRAAYARRSVLVGEALAPVQRLRAMHPEAGMFLLLDVTGTGLSGDDFARRLLAEERVAVMPGSAFGRQAEGFVRVSLTVPDRDLLDACARIAAFARRV